MFLHIADHLFPAVHAEVDVEVRHRHPFRVQEALEQQRIAQGIKIRDRQRIGHKAARPRPPPRPDRDPVILGPFDEIGHDQEVTGETHLLDDAQFEIQPRLILLHRRGVRDHGQPGLQPLIGLPPQFLHLVICKFRQDRLALGRHEGAAPRDLHRILQRLGQIGEQRAHLCLGLQIMLRRQAAARLALVDIGPFRDADQRIMRLVHLGFGEIDVIRGDQRQAHLIGHLDKAALRRGLGLGQPPALAGMALQFHVKPVAETGRQPLHQRARLRTLPLLQEPPHRPLGPARQADQPGGVTLQLLQRHLIKLPRLVQIQAGIQLHQVHVTRLGLRQQHHRRGHPQLFPRLGRIMRNGDLAPHDRLQPGILGQNRKLQRAEHVVRIGHRYRRHLCRRTKLDQFLNRYRAFQQRMFGMDTQMDESGNVRHGRSLAKRQRRGKAAPSFGKR